MKTGEQLKLDGMFQVSTNGAPWHSQLLEYFENKWLPRQSQDRLWTGEDFKKEALADGMPQPHHVNGWGALFGAINRTGTIRCVGLRKARLPNAHARALMLYQKL